MSFTWFSLAMFAVAVILIGLGIWKGIKKGVLYSTLDLCADILGVILGIVSARALSQLIGWILVEFLGGEALLEELLHTSYGIALIARGFLQMLLSASLFVIFFFIVRAITRLVLRIVTARSRRAKRESERNSFFDNTAKNRREKLKGALVGALCGIIVTSVVISPIMGTLKAAGSIIGVVDRLGGDGVWYNLRLKGGEIRRIRGYSKDIVGNICYCMGGGIIYRSAAATTLEGENLSLPNEIDDVSDNVSALLDILPIFEKTDVVTVYEKQKMDALCDSMDASWTMKHISAEFISKCAEAWLKGETYLGISAPQFGKSTEEIFKGILRICQNTDSEHIAEDMRSFFNVYTLIANSGLVSSGYELTTEQLMGAETLMAELEEEIKLNPRIAPIKESIRMTATRMVSEQIHLSKYSIESYQTLMNNLATAINLVNKDKGFSTDAQIRKLTAYTDEYMRNFGLNLTGEIASITSGALFEEFGNNSGNIEASQVEEYFRSLLK